MISARLLIVTTAAIVGCQDTSSGPVSQPSGVMQVLTVPEINANPASYVDDQVHVVGRLHAQPRLTDGPDSISALTSAATLYLVNPEDPTGDVNLLALYTIGRDGQPEPLSCRPSTPADFDCAPYIPGSVVTIPGTWTRQEVPVGQVVSPGGQSRTIARRTAYFLLVH
jgi:hypothetical protein